MSLSDSEKEIENLEKVIDEWKNLALGEARKFGSLKEENIKLRNMIGAKELARLRGESGDIFDRTLQLCHEQENEIKKLKDMIGAEGLTRHNDMLEEITGLRSQVSNGIRLIENWQKENKELKKRNETLEKYREEPYKECVRLQDANLKHGRNRDKLVRCIDKVILSYNLRDKEMCSDRIVSILKGCLKDLEGE